MAIRIGIRHPLRHPRLLGGGPQPGPIIGGGPMGLRPMPIPGPLIPGPPLWPPPPGPPIGGISTLPFYSLGHIAISMAFHPQSS